MRRRWLGLIQQLLSPRLESEECGGDGERTVADEVHVHRDYTPAVCCDARVVAEEDARVACERLLIDFVIDEGAPAVGAAREGQPRERVRRVAPVVEDDVQRAVRRVYRHPSEELR